MKTKILTLPICRAHNRRVLFFLDSLSSSTAARARRVCAPLFIFLEGSSCFWEKEKLFLLLFAAAFSGKNLLLFTSWADGSKQRIPNTHFPFGGRHLKFIFTVNCSFLSIRSTICVCRRGKWKNVRFYCPHFERKK